MIRFFGEFGGCDKQMKILTVANHISILDDLEKQLTHIFPNAKIVKQTDALMAGKYAFNEGVDIVFAEADMKRMNGLQLIQFVRHDHPAVKSFLIGSEKELSESLLIVSEDVTGILTYPLEENAVYNVLKTNEQ